MIVDDHAEFRQVMRTVLAPLAADVVECRDGQEAIEQYAATRPDCVLMDIGMRPLDGLSATAHIISRFPHARIIMVTEYDEADLRRAARQAGASDYVLKEELPRLEQLIQAQIGPGLDSQSSPGPNQ